MGKRTSEKTNDEIRRKIQRLQEELRDRRKTPPTTPSLLPNTGMEDSEYDLYSDDCREEAAYDTYADVGGDADEADPGATLDHECTNVETTTQPDTAPEEDGPASETEVGNRLKSVVVGQTEEEAIPLEILAMLGEAKKSDERFGKKIPSEISERWGKILVEGLAKEQKENLLTKTLTPENFILAKAPKLNAEVASILTDPAKNRDKRLEKMQNQLGAGIAGLANLTSELISKDLNKIDIIRNISEINQILLDLHYEESMNRRRLIIPMLDKSFINVIQGVKREKFLFGDTLGDSIKTTKSIEKSSLQIKKPNLSQPSTSRRPAIQTGNYRAPPRRTNGLGAARAPPAHARYYPPPPPPAARRPPPPPPARRAPPPVNRLRDHRTRR